VTRTGGLRYDRYRFDGHSEWLTRIGPADGIPLLLIPPLFEEMNRSRALLVAAMRMLALEGFSCWLPDLPGTGESERALETCGWADWVGAVQAVADLARAGGGRLMVASLRGGTLLDDIAGAARWRLAPVDGASLARDLDRSGLGGGDGQAGYPMSQAMRGGLLDAVPLDAAPCRVVRLASSPKPADAKLDGPALWRRSEPSSSSELAGSMASDISKWALSCDIC
jgi:pimeloyl-ACP methyl ester carboxylesterase